MYLIAIMGAPEKESELAVRMFESFAQRKRSVVYLYNDQVMRLHGSKRSPGVFSLPSGKKRELKNITPDIIVIQKASKWDYGGLSEASDSWIIVDSQNFEGIELAAKLKGRVISCGLKQNSTLLISGLEGENLTFSLQRRLTNILDCEVEEQDIVVKKAQNLNEFEQGPSWPPYSSAV
jgi:hypothetical protein